MKSFEYWLENKLWLEDKKLVKNTILGLLDFLGDSEKDRLNFHVNNIDSDTKRKIKNLGILTNIKDDDPQKYNDIIEILDNNNILFTYNKTKNNIEKRMVFDTIRNYKYKVNTDDFDEFVTSRIDDLISYEYYVDQNPESIFYKNYYNGQGPSEKFVGLTNFTKNELNSLLDRTHPFYKYEGQEGMTYGFPLAINIKIKIEEVYDSTAVASIYKSRDANIKLRVGDIVKY